jgi:hypothetical protein
VVIDRNGQPFDCAVRVLAAEANRLRREARLVEHLENAACCTPSASAGPSSSGSAQPTTAASRPAFVASGKHFFDAPQRPPP